MNFCIVLEILALPDVGDPLLELLIGDVNAFFLAKLQQQHLVDCVDENLRRDLRDHLLQRLVVLHRLGIDSRVDPAAERGNLLGLELGLGQDVAIDLHEDLLEHFGRHPELANRRRASRRPSRRREP